MEQYGKTVFTSIEIAEHLGVTLRTVNTMIKKLEQKEKYSLFGKKCIANQEGCVELFNWR